MLLEKENVEVVFDVDNSVFITPVIRRIMTSMKNKEKTSSLVKPDYVKQTDGDQVFKYGQQFEEFNWLQIDLEILELTRVIDLYHDETVLYKELRAGEGTGSPYNDC